MTHIPQIELRWVIRADAFGVNYKVLQYRELLWAGPDSTREYSEWQGVPTHNKTQEQSE